MVFPQLSKVWGKTLFLSHLRKRVVGSFVWREDLVLPLEFSAGLITSPHASLLSISQSAAASVHVVGRSSARDATQRLAWHPPPSRMTVRHHYFLVKTRKTGPRRGSRWRGLVPFERCFTFDLSQGERDKHKGGDNQASVAFNDGAALG